MTGSEPFDLTDPGTLVALLQRHGFATRKPLGQHFLVSRKALNAILAACELTDGAPVLEIGPGPGTVTRALAESGAAVTAIEVDTRAVEMLCEVVGEYPNVRVIQGDILAVDLPAVLGNDRWTVVGNLPYYITTPVISRLLESSERIIRAVLMVQREVAERLQAHPGTREYGSLSVFVQVFATIERVAKVPRGAFFPPPNVDSAVVRLSMRSEPLVPSELQPAFFQIVHAAFGQRRKTLHNALTGGGILAGDKEAVARLLEAAGMNPTRRGETLSIAEFRVIAERISGIASS
ncbi:MAG: 16S rRNA (adenine(1518)-N(6)/adenine(1519)-N(6))-dimethyltransferase RsmA [Armatimonadota bacterium]